VVGVLVDHDIVAIPIPVIAVGKVKRGDAEVETAKPETPGIAPLQAPPVCTAEAAVEAPMLPRMPDAKAIVVAPALVSDPFAVVVDVWGFRVTATVAIRTPVSLVVPVALVPVAMMSLGTVARNVSATDVTMVVVSVVVVVMLRESRQGKDQRRRKNSEE
jgi:hypothetical protein